MESSLRVVARFPLTELWNASGAVAATKGLPLSEHDISVLLRNGEVQFVVADVGHALRWIPTTHCYQFWKTEAKGHIAKPDSRICLDDFSGAYAFLATEWNCSASLPIVVLEQIH